MGERYAANRRSWRRTVVMATRSPRRERSERRELAPGGGAHPQRQRQLEPPVRVVESLAQHVAKMPDAVADSLHMHVQALGGRAVLPLRVEPGAQRLDESRTLRRRQLV